MTKGALKPNRLRALIGDARGVTALEYALVAPFFFIILFLSIEVNFMLLADASLDRAATQISRMGKIGEFAGQDCRTKVRSQLADALSTWANVETIFVDVQVYHPGADTTVDFEDPDYTPKCDAGGRGDMVIYHLGFNQTSFTGILAFLGIDVFRYRRTVIIQNEP